MLFALMVILADFRSPCDHKADGVRHRYSPSGRGNDRYGVRADDGGSSEPPGNLHFRAIRGVCIVWPDRETRGAQGYE